MTITKQQLHSVVTYVHAMEKPANRGICSLARVASNRLGLGLWDKKRLWDLFALWPHFTGSATYPVPCTAEIHKVLVSQGRATGPFSHDSEWFWRMQAFEHAERRGLMWSGEYGEMRQDLLNFLIRETS